MILIVTKLELYKIIMITRIVLHFDFWRFGREIRTRVARGQGRLVGQSSRR